MRGRYLASSLVLILLLLNASWTYGGGKKRSPRILGVMFQVQHAYRCTACAAKIAEILRRQEGVRNVRTFAEQDSAVAYFESGKTDLDEIRKSLKMAGFVAAIVWGPTAAKVDGSFEEEPLDEIAIKRPTLKELKDSRDLKAKAASAANAGQEKKATVYVPGTSEKVPVPSE